ncbi:MAG TPA: hypothetical protein VGB30_09995 [bacterium]|jgi:hypothetical protein
MFFLITYGMVNMVTFIEQVIGIVSFRPAFRIPAFVSLYGAVSCLAIMLLISPIARILAILLTSLIYFLLIRAGLVAKWGDVRSGLLSSIAGWAARQAVHLPRHEKSWKPDLLLPLEDPKNSTDIINFTRDICFPGGNVIAFSVSSGERVKKLAQLDDALKPIKKEQMFFISSVVEGDDFVHETRTIIQMMHETFFRPNVLLITLSDNPGKDEKIHQIIDDAIEEKMGTAILLALQLYRNWEGATLNLVALARDDDEARRTTEFFEVLKEDARLPVKTAVNVVQGEFPGALANMPECDIAIFGLGDTLSPEQIRRIQNTTQVTCLFIRDSGYESAFV